MGGGEAGSLLHQGLQPLFCPRSPFIQGLSRQVRVLQPSHYQHLGLDDSLVGGGGGVGRGAFPVCCGIFHSIPDLCLKMLVASPSHRV